MGAHILFVYMLATSLASSPEPTPMFTAVRFDSKATCEAAAARLGKDFTELKIETWYSGMRVTRPTAYCVPA